MNGFVLLCRCCWGPKFAEMFAEYCGLQFFWQTLLAHHVAFGEVGQSRTGAATTSPWQGNIILEPTWRCAKKTGIYIKRPRQVFNEPHIVWLDTPTKRPFDLCTDHRSQLLPIILSHAFIRCLWGSKSLGMKGTWRAIGAGICSGVWASLPLRLTWQQTLHLLGILIHMMNAIDVDRHDAQLLPSKHCHIDWTIHGLDTTIKKHIYI